MALHHVAPGEIAHLIPLSDREAGVRTQALAKTDRFEAIRLVVPAEASIAEHDVAGPITLHCLEGKVRLGRREGALLLQAGDWIHLSPGEAHSVQGVEDASLLLTIIF
jgi:quercetin dioxygenase-like cupin family protein